ncbi:S24 family peptidase (plasmid) [Clostridium baratii]
MKSFSVDKNLFALNMKTLRKNLNLTQIDAAEKLNITRTSLMNYESGKSLPEINILLNICALYKCSLNNLLGIENISIIDSSNVASYNESEYIDTLKKFKEQLSTLTSLNLKHVKLNNEIKAEKNKLILNNKRLNSSKNKYSKMIDNLIKIEKQYKSSLEKLNKTQEKYSSLLLDLNSTKEEYNKLLNKLKNSQDFHLNSTKDIDETRDYFLSSFSTILNNANSLVKELESSLNTDNNIAENTDKPIIKEITPLIDFHNEVSDELIPEVNCDDSSYIDEEDTEPTVKVAYFPDESTAAGAPIGYSEYPSMQYMELKARYPLTSENSDNFFIIKVEGNSMNKLVEDGTKILVRANRFIENGTIALVNIVDKEGTTLKYYYYDPITRSVTLSPYSTDPSYTDMVFSDKDRVLIHGEYIGPISDFL